MPVIQVSSSLLLNIFILMSTDDDVIIADPEGEYDQIVNAFGGQVIDISTNSTDHINAMDMTEGYGDSGNSIADKSQFIMSLFEQLDTNHGGISSSDKSIIDRCVAYVYQDARKGNYTPTLKHLYRKLLDQPEAEAQSLAIKLELFTNGSLNIFAHETNVNIRSRVMSFNIFNLGKQLKTMGLLVITDAIINRVNDNWRKGKRTHVFIDEIHVIFENEESATFFASAWRQFRKRDAFPTGITQNVKYLLSSQQGTSMLSNSLFIVMLNQSPNDREDLAKLLNISDEQMSYITNAQTGCGLIRYGGSIVPFVNRMPNQMISIDADVLSSYVERWKAIKELEETGLQILQENLQELRDKQHALSGMILTRLFELYSTEDVLSDEVRNNKLLTFLLRRGYIDEKYANYINYFKGTSITKDDMNFILSVKNQSPLAFDYQLTKTSMVVERLQDYEFEQKAIYNFDLLEEMLAKGPATKLTAFVVQLADGNEISWKFIDEFISKTAHLDHFIRLLAESWTGMWAYISADETLTYERQLLYLHTILNVSDTATIEAQNGDSCLAHYFEQHDDILQKLASGDTSNIISAINCLDVCFETLQITGVPHEVLDCIFDGCHYKLNDPMIRTVVTYKYASMVNMLSEQPYSTIIDLKYAPMTQYIHDSFVAYIREVVLVHATLSDRAEDVVDMLIRLKNEEDLQIQLIIQENILLNSIEECAGDHIQEESDTWRPVWDALLAENSIIINWENIIAYWKVYKLSDELKRYISSHVDELSAMDTAVVDDVFIRMFIMANFASEVEKKLIPVLRMHTFNLDIPSIDESTLRIMIDCRYFEFTVNHYSAIASVSPDIGIEFILKNQDEYMDLRNSISMPVDLFERLMFSDGFRQEYKSQLFSEYAENCMTEKIALQMNTLHLPITKDILYVAWNCVDQEKHGQLLLENCTILDADELEQRFEEIGGIYAELADRTRRHEATLSAIPQHKLLAEHLQAVGYITSWEEKNEKFYDPVLEKETSRKFLKFRIKQVK